MGLDIKIDCSCTTFPLSTFTKGHSSSCHWHLLKGYLRYETITSQNVLSKAQIKKFFISQRNYFRSRDIQVQVFVFLTIP